MSMLKTSFYSDEFAFCPEKNRTFDKYKSYLPQKFSKTCREITVFNRVRLYNLLFFFLQTATIEIISYHTAIGSDNNKDSKFILVTYNSALFYRYGESGWNFPNCSIMNFLRGWTTLHDTDSTKDHPISTYSSTYSLTSMSWCITTNINSIWLCLIRSIHSMP